MGGKVTVLLVGLLMAGGGLGLAWETPASDPVSTKDDDALARLGVALAHKALQDEDLVAAFEALIAARADALPDAGWDTAARQAAALRALTAGLASGDVATTAGAVAEAQALQASIVLPETKPLPRLAPSDAVLALAADHGLTVQATLAPDTLAQVRALDLLPRETADALAETLQAFRAFAAADRAVQEPADLGAVLAARAQLAAAAAKLAETLDGATFKSSNAPLEVENILSLDLGPGANTYAKDFVLLIDVGGNDVYTNNAGGSAWIADPCSNTLRAAAALIDLGGDDQYRSGGSCGVNGGARGGSGFLFDRGGNDLYIAGGEGANGGALATATGFLYDTTGSDVYTGESLGVNGGGIQFGMGALVETGGNDRYEALALGTNGGSAQTGYGMLIDSNGLDTYAAGSSGTNGGASFNGAALLYDGNGADSYTAGSSGTNGGGDRLGVGLLFDGAGNDAYRGERLGANGGAARAGLGALFDGAGNDRYDARDKGANGGAYAAGPGMLFDASGDDAYSAEGESANGGAALGGTSPDNRVCPVTAVCQRLPTAWGLLFDGGGLDQYVDIIGAAGTDLTIAPKGFVGAQVDFRP